MTLLLALLLAADPYGPLVDTYTGTKCPTPIRGADIYDMSLYKDFDMLRIAPAVATRCLKMRQQLIDAEARKRPLESEH